VPAGDNIAYLKNSHSPIFFLHDLEGIAPPRLKSQYRKYMTKWLVSLLNVVLTVTRSVSFKTADCVFVVTDHPNDNHLSIYLVLLID